MTQKDADFLQQLLATFQVEAEEHVQAMGSDLLALEKATSDEERRRLAETVFRAAHSLKGAARAVGQTVIENLCQALESALSRLKRGEVSLTTPLFDLLHEALAVLGRVLSGREAGGVPEPSLRRLIEALGQAENVPQPAERGSLRQPPDPQPEPARPAAPEVLTASGVLRVSAAKLNALLLGAEELLPAKLMTQQHGGELREIISLLRQGKKEREQITRDLHPLRRLVSASGTALNGSLTRVLAFLERKEEHSRSVEARLTKLEQDLEDYERLLRKTTEELLEDAKKLMMVPLSSLVEPLRKLVRDLSRDRGKQVELVIRGAEIEADRRILEGLKDPLIHLLRNCVDHGIEPPEQRQARGKPPQGTITLSVQSKEGSKIELQIADDGGGIEVSQLRAATSKLGLVPAEKLGQMTEAELLPLVFESGVSTAPMVTEISGRGLGLAIVREKVEAMDGQVSVESRPGAGTVFRLLLPTTRTSLRGVLVRAGDQLFTVPVAHLERVLRVGPQDVRTVENRETISWAGETISLARLGAVLALPQTASEEASNGSRSALLLRAAGLRMAFLVDEVLNEQEILMKGLGQQIARLRNVSGATILGNGKVVPVLNVADLMKAAVKASATPAIVPPTAAARASHKSILLVEDSITARTLLKNILEAAPYKVRTAVDGMDAFATLKTDLFDLVVSDVEMPRMSGFELTAKIRADKTFAGLPVVLVTALESREDREHGILVGANAYLVKKSFDQSNLLEVVRRLVGASAAVEQR